MQICNQVQIRAADKNDISEHVVGKEIAAHTGRGERGAGEAGDGVGGERGAGEVGLWEYQGFVYGLLLE
jgi:hypothetical protein